MTAPGSSRIYLDEDSGHTRLVRALRLAGIDVLTAVEARRTEQPDREQLSFAVETRRVLYTANRADYARLHAEFGRTGTDHHGIIICPRQATTPEWQAQEITRILQNVDPTSMRNTIHYIRPQTV